MKSRAISVGLAFMLLCFLPLHTAAQDYTSWIRYSDSGDNDLIVEMIEQGDLATGLDVAEALGLREDVQIQEIILAVGEQITHRSSWERELILRVMLASVFAPTLESSELERRLRANRDGIDFLVANLHQFGLSLKREVTRVLSFLHPPEYLGTLMAEGRRITEILREQEGRLNGEQAALTLTFLETVDTIADPEFANLVLLILERTRHLEVGEKARSVSRSLLVKD
ncbi:MAG: hypothetical protein KAR73_06020 [Spirochaetales bacterium]|nr:hypothetical protein [Spirochaetales bacterium]